MKELSIEEKANAYDNVRNKIATRFGTNVAQEIFSEYEESEDEKIKNEIKVILANTDFSQFALDYTFADMLTWLEKQGQKPVIEMKTPEESLGIDSETYNEIVNDCIFDEIKPKFNVGDWVVNKGHSYLIAAIDFHDNRYLFEIGGYTHEQLNWEHVENVDKNYHLWTLQDAKPGDVLVSQYNKPFIYNGNYNEYKVGAYCGIDTVGEFIDARPERCWTNNESISPATKEQRDMLFQKMHEAGYEWDTENKQLKKIVQKFNVGDWVLNNVCFPVQIASVKDGMYVFAEGDALSVSFVDENYHLWTLQDAMDGDILVSQYNQPFIYNGNYNEYRVGAYCGIEYTGKEFIDTCTENICWTNNESIKPAAKEQCDMLFQKMHEAGYTFDFEKKELKKIKFKVGDEIITENEESLTITKIDKEGYWSNDLFICDFDEECIWDLVEQKPTEWSEEDNETLDRIISNYKYFCTELALKEKLTDVERNVIENVNKEDVEWLKSIKDRCTCKPSSELDEASYQVGIKRVLENPESYGLTKYNWKPTKGQMEALKNACDKSWEPDGLDPLYTLYEDLKKLKGK